MDFRKSGLPADGLVEEAFYHSYASLGPMRKEAVQDVMIQIDTLFDKESANLDRKKKDEGMSDELYRLNKDKLEKWREGKVKSTALVVKNEMDRQFMERRVGPAREIAEHAGNPTPELMAAAMLADGVRSPIDYMGVQQKFGDKVATLVAWAVHVDTYVALREENLKAAPADVRLLIMALTISSLTHTAGQIEKAIKSNPGQEIILPPGQQETLCRNIRVLWGGDGKLEQRLLAAFNGVAVAAALPFSMELDDAGLPQLVKTPPVRRLPPRIVPPRPPGGGGPLGGDVF